MNALVWLTEPLSYQFMVRALTTSVVAAVVCALLSCWLVLVGWSLMGDAVSHAVLPGVALAYILDLPFALGAVVFGFLAVILIGVVRGTSRVKEDAAIGIVFTTMFALGLILISTTPSQTDLNHIIFGNVLGITKADMVQVAILAGISLLVLLLKRRDLTLYARGSPARDAGTDGGRRPADRRGRSRRGDADHSGSNGLPAHRPILTDARHRAEPVGAVHGGRHLPQLLVRRLPRRPGRRRAGRGIPTRLPLQPAPRRRHAGTSPQAISALDAHPDGVGR